MAKDKTADEELPEAANQKAIERKLRDILGPPPQEATIQELEESRKPPEPEIVVTDSIPVTAPVLAGAAVPKEPVEDKPVAAQEEVEDDTPEDEATAEAVDEIVAKEGDDVLAAEDADMAKAFEQPKTGLKAEIKHFFKSWWDNKIARYATISLLVLGLITAGVWPTSRYFVLNTVGVRGSASLTVTDDSNQQPVKNIQVSLGGQSALTDGDGKARLTHLKLGKSLLVIKKRAYAEQSKTVTVGWGSNPLGDFSLKATGTQYRINAVDALSGKPIPKAQVASGLAEATSGQDGQMLLAIDIGEATSVDAVVSAQGYREEIINFSADIKTVTTVRMTPKRKEVFVSKRSGTYDVYKVDLDGKNEKLVLRGSGSEQDNLVLVSHPTDEVVALVSTRDKAYNSDGFQLSTLTLIDLSNDSTKSLVQSERVQLLGWAANRLVYIQIAAGTSAANPKRYRLMSYDYKLGDKRELATSNYFNDVELIGDSIYYAPTNPYVNDPATGFFKTNGDGTTKQKLMTQEVSNSLRVSYETLDLAVGESWYEYKIGTSAPTKIQTAPPNYISRIYVDSPDRSHSLWVDNRDGKGVLLVYSPTPKTDKILVSQSGLVNPVRWVTNNTIIYRIHTDQETADYVLNIDGGAAKKIKDVTNTRGLDQWYYY